MASITILGSGGFGLALAVLCDRIGHEVTVWSAFKDEIDAILRTGELKSKLPGVTVPESIKLTTDISCVSGKDIVIVGIPTQFVRDVCGQAKPYISPETIIVSTAKGLENETFKRMSEVISETLPDNKIVVLSGPSHAEELARGIPTAVAVASDYPDCAEYIQKTISDGTLRLYVNHDVIGCEIGGALKNIIALCSGILEGMELGDNSRAALMTRGLNEMTRLGVKLGARPETFVGLSGLGDLIVTCTSMHSRNFRAGILIGKGIEADEAVRRVGTVEGYTCAKVAYDLAKSLGVEMPITEELHKIMFENKDRRAALRDLMYRPYRSETTWSD